MNKPLNDYQTYLVEEFAEQYLTREMSRRDMLRRVLAVTGSVPIAASMLFALGCGDDNKEPEQVMAPATATTVPTPVGPGVSATDPAIQATDVRFTGPASEMRGYLARPSKTGQFAAVLVIHENNGLQDHFKDLARRYARENFVALAMDLVSRTGGTTADPAQNAAATRADPAEIMADLNSGLTYLKSQQFVKSGGFGVTGFCVGGGYTFEMAITNPEIKAAVPFYGPMRAGLIPELSKTNAAILAMYGGRDTNLMQQVPQVEQTLKAAGKTFEVKVYPDANHVFFNDTRPPNTPGGFGYSQEAATAAWPIVLAWFRKYLPA